MQPWPDLPFGLSSFPPDWTTACAASLHAPLNRRRGRASFTGIAWTGMMVGRLMQSIAATATRSGHPYLVFAIVSLVFSALTALTLRCLIDLL
jgi:fucose permease